MGELYKQYRPRLFKEVIGQPNAIKTLNSMVKKGRVPHTILFSGDSGCGKTTLARILAKKLGCGKIDLAEVNAAKDRGIDLSRSIESRMGLSPVSGKCRVWIIDECHQLTSQSQSSFLKILEDTPSHVYFLLCTTDPHKLLKAIRNRCTDITVQPLQDEDMEALVKSIQKKEKIKLTEDVFDKLVKVADGSPRRALVLLNKLRELSSENEQLNELEKVDVEKHGIEIARALMNPRCQWSDISKIIQAVTEEPESIRWMILSYYEKVALGGGKMAARAIDIMNCFRDNYYDSKRSGLILSCWEASHRKSGNR